MERGIFTTNPFIDSFVKENYENNIGDENMNYGTTDGKIKDNTLNSETDSTEKKYYTTPEFYRDVRVVYNEDQKSTTKMKYLQNDWNSIVYHIENDLIYYAILPSKGHGPLEFKTTDDLREIINELNLS